MRALFLAAFLGLLALGAPIVLVLKLLRLVLR